MLRRIPLPVARGIGAVRRFVSNPRVKSIVRRAMGNRRMSRSIPRPFKRRRILRAPVARSLRVPRARGVSVRSAGTKSVTFSNREFIQNVAVSNNDGFQLLFSGDISPSNAQLFPWLASIANHFEMFKINKFRVVYEPSCTSSAMGQVMLAIDYDPADASPSDWSSMSAWRGSKHGCVWSPHVMQADGNIRRRRVYYTGTSGLPSNAQQDPRETAAGRVYCAVEGVTNNGTVFAAGSTIGKLYVEYSVSFYIPQFGNDLIAAGCGTGCTLSADSSYNATIIDGLTSGGVQDVFQYLTTVKGVINMDRPAATPKVLRCLTPFQGYITIAILGKDCGVPTEYPDIYPTYPLGMSGTCTNELVARGDPGSGLAGGVTLIRKWVDFPAGTTFTTYLPTMSRTPSGTIMVHAIFSPHAKSAYIHES